MADYLGYERAFKRAGIPYSVEPGAYERGHGDMADVRFIVCHHTAGGNDAGDIRVVRDGRPDLDGPLSQLMLLRDGSVRIIAVGVCWQAYGTIDYKGVKAGAGNYWSIGIEGVSNGRDDWTPEQRRNYPKVVAALLVDKALPPDAWIFHRDYQPGEKIDPVGFTKEQFGKEVTEFYNSLSGKVVKDMANQWVSAVNNAKFTDADFMRFVDYHLWRIDKLLTQQARLIDKLPTSDEELKKV